MSLYNSHQLLQTLRYSVDKNDLMSKHFQFPYANGKLLAIALCSVKNDIISRDR